jgi:hypothetical protein
MERQNIMAGGAHGREGHLLYGRQEADSESVKGARYDLQRYIPSDLFPSAIPVSTTFQNNTTH